MIKTYMFSIEAAFHAIPFPECGARGR